MQEFQPDFSYLLTCLQRKPTDRPVLFEFYMNDNVYNTFTEGMPLPSGDKDFTDRIRLMYAFKNMGYDYATMLPPTQYFFPIIGEHHADTRTYSLNEGSHIDSWEAFEAYPWPDFTTGDYRYLEKVFPYIPEGMKLIPSGPGGMEEIVISLTGYETLCFLMIDNPELVDALFEAVGTRLVSYYRDLCTFDEVGACLSNDDWGFNTQTLFSPQHMQRWVFPWHQKIADTIHASGKPAILHSCGNIYSIFDVVTDQMKYEGKHSYEDSILPVEDAWDRYHDKIAIMGGIDVNYMIMESEEAVYQRSSALLDRTQSEGAFALGTGNSVPDYLPTEKFIALLKAAWDRRS